VAERFGKDPAKKQRERAARDDRRAALTVSWDRGFQHCQERVWDNGNGFFAVWTRDLRRRRRYTSVRHALAEHG
jgi:hypothetical protein